MSSKLLSVFFVIAGLAVWAFALDTTAAGTKVQGVPGVLADPAQFQRRSEPAASIAGNWRLTGNAGTNSTNFLGTTDGQPLNFRVNDQRALRLEPNSQSPNVIGGSGVNVAEAGTVGSTIGGGGMANLPNVVSGVLATIGGGGDNRVENTAATIAGGIDNRATGGQATVGGGIANAASADRATVGGGRQNRATGEGATIPGGAFNLALGSFSFAAGYRAHAGDAGSFVWGDSTNEDVSSTGPDQFVVRARGGLHLRDGQLFCDGCVTVDDLAPGTTQGLRPYCALVRAHPMSYEGAPCLHHSETVDGFTGNTSIAIGTDGNPVVSYTGAGGTLKVAHCEDPSCTSSTTQPLATTSDYTSIAIGTDGNPVVGYTEAGSALKFARCGDRACAASTLQSLDARGITPSVAVGPDGNPVISYSGPGSTLKVARPATLS